MLYDVQKKIMKLHDLLVLYNYRKWFFLALVAISFLFLYLLNNRLGGSSTFAILHEALFIPELNEEIHHRDELYVHSSQFKSGLSDSNHKQHKHDEEIGFVLHESDLGAPEFIGRNQKIFPVVENDPNTFLNVQDFDNQISPLFTDSDYPERSIAIGCALTTRNEVGLTSETLEFHLPFFRGLLSSFCTTATRGFNYHFYVAHDHTDPFFISDNAHYEFKRTFHEQLSKFCQKKINTTLHLVECHHSGNPAWAQNDAMMAAYMDNMDYYYRVNDDTVMETTGWTEKFIDELRRFNPPNVGVVGPWFKEGNVVILTHDFVHRTHIDIFGFYYPRVFTDWFADDWITNVYWPERCRKVPGTRVKHTMEKGQRYVAHYEKAGKVKVESDIGKNIITRYIKRIVDGKIKGEWEKDAVGVVSTSLYGSDVGLIYGCLRYAQLLPVIFPKWRLRVYVSMNESSSKVLKILVRKLENFDVEVVNIAGTKLSLLPPKLWRYLIADDVKVNRFIVRDTNTRPSQRELAALDDWIISSNSDAVYCIRDHVKHSVLPLSPGMIGGIPRLIKSQLRTSIESILTSQAYTEEQFLTIKLWPILKNSTFCHDSVSCYKWPSSHFYPALRSGNEFVGRKFDSNDQSLQDEENDDWLDEDTSSSDDHPCVVLKNTGFYESAVQSVVKLRPVFWSQDYHMTPMMDIKSLLQPIGIKVIDNSLSFHCAKIGTCAKNLKVINSDNGMALGEEIIKKFYEAYKTDLQMASVSAFVCTLPVSMCEAFRPFHKSMIVWASIRYEQARSEPDQWENLNRMLREIDRDESSVLAANNLYDAKYIEYFTGLKPKLIPNYCAYLTETYTPTRKQFLVTPIHSTELYDIFFAEFDNAIMQKDVDLTIFPLREMYPQYLYSDLASHKGIIYVPYQVSMISLTEQYRMNIPLFFPSLNLLTQWHLKYQVVRQRTWSGYMMKRSESSNIKGMFPQVPDPNNDVDEDAIRYWLKFADFYQWPHLVYFDSIDDLVEKMANVDLNEISNRMKKHNEKVRAAIKSAWSEVLVNITNNIRKSPRATNYRISPKLPTKTSSDQFFVSPPPIQMTTKFFRRIGYRNFTSLNVSPKLKHIDTQDKDVDRKDIDSYKKQKYRVRNATNSTVRLNPPRKEDKAREQNGDSMPGLNRKFHYVTPITTHITTQSYFSRAIGLSADATSRNSYRTLLPIADVQTDAIDKKWRINSFYNIPTPQYVEKPVHQESLSGLDDSKDNHTETASENQLYSKQLASFNRSGNRGQNSYSHTEKTGRSSIIKRNDIMENKNMEEHVDRFRSVHKHNLSETKVIIEESQHPSLNISSPDKTSDQTRSVESNKHQFDQNANRSSVTSDRYLPSKRRKRKKLPMTEPKSFSIISIDSRLNDSRTFSDRTDSPLIQKALGSNYTA